MKLLYIFCMAITPWALLSMDKYDDPSTTVIYEDIDDKNNGDDDNINLTKENNKIPRRKRIEPYLGSYPSGTSKIENSLISFTKMSLDEKKNYPFPNLIKVVGPTGIGKTTLIKNLAHKLKAKFVKIDPKNKTDLQLSNQTYIEQIINNFYKPDINLLHIFSIPKQVQFKNVRKLKAYLSNNQQILAPLIVFVESRKLDRRDSRYYDETIQIKKLKDSNIRAIIENIIRNHNLPKHTLSEETIELLRKCLPEEIISTVNRAIRIAYCRKASHITNDHIIEAFKAQVVQALSFSEESDNENSESD